MQAYKEDAAKFKNVAWENKKNAWGCLINQLIDLVGYLLNIKGLFDNSISPAVVIMLK